MSKTWLKLQLVIGAMLLAGCGGSDDPAGRTGSIESAGSPTCLVPPEGPPNPLVPGIYGGTVQGLPDTSFVLVVRSAGDGSGASVGWVFVGPDLATQAKLIRVAWLSNDVQCTGDGRTFNTHMLGGSEYVHLALDPAVPSLGGTVRLLDHADTTYPMTGGPIAGSSFDTMARPQVGDFAGTWVLTELNGAKVELSMAADGKFSGHHRGCRFSGTATADTELNMVSLPARFDSVQTAGCSVYHPDKLAVDGFALLIPAPGGGAQLIVRVVWGDGWDGVAMEAIGRR